MVSESKQSKKSIEQTRRSLYFYNRRKLKIALEKNCLSREQHSRIKTELDNQLNGGGDITALEDICSSFFPMLSFEKILPIINKEIFKYNQIIVKLAHQFAKNTATQQFKLQQHDAVSIQQFNQKLQDIFSKILKDITNDYLISRQKNIDDILLESGFIQQSHLEFLHGSAQHLEIKVQDRKFGEIAVKNEFTSEEIVNKALDEQTVRYKKTNKNHIIGDILVEHNHITPEIRDEILILQNRVIEEDWEETLKKVGSSSMEEREKNALFGAIILKERLLDEKQIIEALRIQAKEFEECRKKDEINKKTGSSVMNEFRETEERLKPRWIGDILVEDFGLSERDRKRIVKKQMAYKIERINLKFGLNLSNAHIELFNEMEQYFELSYSKDNIEAYIKVLKPVPESMTKDNIIIWLYHKKIRYGRIINAIESLIANKVGLGKKILLAKGDEPVLAQIKYRFHFDTQTTLKHTQIFETDIQRGETDTQTSVEDTQSSDSGIKMSSNSGNILKFIVPKGSQLITIRKTKGKSGINVNHCFVAPPIVVPISINKGKNVIRKGDSFVASCDGMPCFSDRRVISVISMIHIDGDISPENLPKNLSAQFDCDFDIEGTVQSGVVLGCRKLRVANIMGKVTVADEIKVLHDTINGEIFSRGNIYAASIENSLVTSEKSIFVQLDSEQIGTGFNKIYHSIITSNDIFRASNTKIVSSVVRAKNKVILKKVTVGEKCKFIVGDSIEVISCKKRVEAIASDIDKLDIKIKDLQEKSRFLFEKLEKKDIGAIDQEIKAISRNQRTKEDLDKIAELRVIKRQKEKEYEASIDQYSNTFMKHSQQINLYQDQKKRMEKEKNELENRIVGIYKKDTEIPELDIRRTMLPAGTVIQFRYNQQHLSTDCEGFVFREEFNHQTNRYELKQHRW
ncbi:MAG: hypothetical protein HQK62_09270 [Desulfamplus sp.]|nr:hypothetical protein [Desulfamplus sp.]